MKIKLSKLLVLFIASLLAVGICYKFTTAEGELTGGEFIIKLAQSLDLSYRLPDGATVDDYINVLVEKGFVLPAGFNPKKPITKEQKADLLSQVLNIEDTREGKTRMEVYRNKAVIKKISGNVMVKLEGKDEWSPAEVEMKLAQGDYIKTGPDSSVFLMVGVAGRIEIRENSELLLKNVATQDNKKSENILLYLAMGEMSVDVRFIHRDTIFKTQTPTTLASVRGTIYIVKVTPIDGKTEISEK